MFCTPVVWFNASHRVDLNADMVLFLFGSAGILPFIIEWLVSETSINLLVLISCTAGPLVYSCSCRCNCWCSASSSSDYSTAASDHCILSSPTSECTIVLMMNSGALPIVADIICHSPSGWSRDCCSLASPDPLPLTSFFHPLVRLSIAHHHCQQEARPEQEMLMV